MILNILLKPGYLKHDRLHLYAKSLGQDKYQFHHDGSRPSGRLRRKHRFLSQLAENIIPAEDLNTEERFIMVFEDAMLERHGPIEKYFCQGRHGGVDTFYLTQSFFKIPKQAIRDHANLLVIFNQDTKILGAIHDSYVGGDMAFEEFKDHQMGGLG